MTETRQFIAILGTLIVVLVVLSGIHASVGGY